MILLLTLVLSTLAVQPPTNKVFEVLGNLSMSKWVVGHLDSTIVLGSTGVGKSTLIDLLAGCKLAVKHREGSTGLMYDFDESRGCGDFT